MAIVLKDRVKVTSGVTGTGTATLGAAAVGYQDFSAIGNGNITYYTIALQSGNEWEVGKGTVTFSGGTWFLSRDAVFESSAGGTAVNFSAGTKDVFVTYPAERAIFEEPDGQTLIDGGPITVLGDNVTTNPSLEAELGKFVGNVDSFGQVYNLNQSDGSSASADFVVYNDQTTDGFTHFTDMGINSSNYSSVDYPLFTPGSGYVFHDGDDFFIGNQTAAKDVVLFAGGVTTANEAVRIKGSDQSVELAGNLSVTGTATITGAAEFQSTVLLDADPTLALQAATKQYVDNAVATGLHVHEPVRVKTTANLTATYNNGSSGVGATLTNSGTQVALSIDGISLSVNDRVLVWQQTTQTQNGVYVVTTVGSGSTNWVLTRSSDADTYSAQDTGGLGGGDYFYVQEGLTGAGDSYICTNEGTITFGTTAITFSQFSGAITYVGGTNINVTGQTISLTGTVAPTNGGTGVNTVTTGDLLYGSASNTWAKLPLGTAYKSLVVNASGTQVEWNAIALNQSGAVSGTLPTGNGGTGLTTYTLGDILYSSATNTLSKLAGNATTTKLFLSQTGTGGGSAAPAWAQPTASDISGLAASATTDTTNAANITSGTLPVARLNGSYTGITGVGTLAAGTWNASTIAAIYGGTGQTSYTQGDLLYATSSTTVGKLADVAAGNALLSGGVGADPAWGKVGLTTHVSGTLAVANGGTGATTLTGYVYGNGTGAMTASTTIPNSATTATSANTASAIVARDASGNFSAGTITASLSGNATSATSATSATTATNLAGGVAGAVPYQSASGTTLFSAAGTSGQVLQSNGTTAPTWVTPAAVNNGTLSLAVSGTGLSGSATFTANQAGNSTFTVTSNATNANTASTIVARDASGNFSAGTITAALSGNATTATTATTANATAAAVTFNNSGTGAASGTTFNGSTAQTISHNTVGASPLAGSASLTTTGTVTSGTWSASFGAVSGANLTNLTAGNLTGTIPSGVLGNSSLNIGTTSVALNRASANQALTGITSITFPGSVSGSVQLIPAATAGTGTVLTMPATTGTVVTTGDTGTVTSTMIANDTIVNADISPSAAIAVSKLAASTISGVTLGGTLNTLTMNTSGTGLSGSTTYNGSGAATFTVTSNATNANTASTIVARDASGNFSAGVITATLNGTASAATSATTATTANSLNTANNYQVNSIGVGAAASGTAGRINATTGVFTPNAVGVSTGLTVVNGDVTAYRSGGTTGVIYLSSSGSNYLYWDGSSYYLGANIALSTGNYNSYAPTLTGGGASGTWGINVTGNAATATTLQTARTINGVSFNGSANITVTANTPNSLTLATSGTGLSGSATFNGGSAQTFTVTSNATSVNTASTIVARDGSGNFSAGTITATLNGNASTATTATTASTATNVALGTSGSGGAIYENSQTIASNYTLTSGRNGMSAGPVTINSGVTVTVPSGSSWVIV